MIILAVWVSPGIMLLRQRPNWLPGLTWMVAILNPSRAPGFILNRWNAGPTSILMKPPAGGHRQLVAGLIRDITLRAMWALQRCTAPLPKPNCMVFMWFRPDRLCRYPPPVRSN